MRITTVYFLGLLAKNWTCCLALRLGLYNPCKAHYVSSHTNKSEARQAVRDERVVVHGGVSGPLVSDRFQKLLKYTV